MKKLTDVLEPFGGPIAPTEEMMNSATATMHTRSILQNGAAVIVFIAGIGTQALMASAQSVPDGTSNGMTLITSAAHDRSLTHRPRVTAATTHFQRETDLP